MIQACSNFHGARVLTVKTRPDETDDGIHRFRPTRIVMPSPPASERRGNILKRFKYFDLEAKDMRDLAYVCHNCSATVVGVRTMATPVPSSIGATLRSAPPPPLKDGSAVASIETNRQLPRGAPATFEPAAARLLPPTAAPSVCLSLCSTLLCIFHGHYTTLSVGLVGFRV